MRVLYVIDELGEGGAEQSLADLLPRFVAGGIEPTIAHLRSRGGEGVEDALAARYDVRLLGPGSALAQLAWLLRLVREVHPDLVHTTLYRSNLLGRAAGALTRTPVVSSLVNTSWSPARLADPRLRRGRVAMARRIDAFTARRLTRAIHAVSEAVKQDAVDHLGVDPGRVHVVHRGRDRERLGRPSPERRRSARRKLDVGETAPLIVNVGRQERQKGQRFLLEAMESVLRSHPDALLLVAGREGNETGALAARVAEAALSGRVRFLGHRGDVPDLLAAADVFVLASLYEGLPGALLEAMALGLPVVCTDIPANREVVEKGGNALLVPPADAGALASALASMLDDPLLRQRMGAAGLAVFEERFTIETSAERMLELYRAVV